MDAKTLDGKRTWKPNNVEGEADDDMEDDEEEGSGVDQDKKKTGFGRRGSGSGGSGGALSPCCVVEKCGADLTDAKRYHKRHKVCEIHAKAPVVMVAGLRQRFCQQCSRFHELPEFDETKRSCRRRLAGHNERRRKSSTEPYGGESSNRKGVTPPSQCWSNPDERGKPKVNIPGTSGYKRSQIR
ncbi:hypothetical protein ACFE04_008054 [Oxalis oulophora]